MLKKLRDFDMDEEEHEMKTAARSQVSRARKAVVGALGTKKVTLTRPRILGKKLVK